LSLDFKGLPGVADRSGYPRSPEHSVSWIGFHDESIHLFGERNILFVRFASIDLVRPLVVLVLLNFHLNFALKEAFSLPRPPAHLHWTTASGHAQRAMVLLGYLAWSLKQYWWPTVVIFGL